MNEHLKLFVSLKPWRWSLLDCAFALITWAAVDAVQDILKQEDLL